MRLLPALLASALLLAVTAGGALAAGPDSARHPVGREPLTIDLGDFQAKAELDYPVDLPRAPVVVLVPGSGPEDMNADICGFGSTPLSHNFLDIADYLVPRGIAVMRYDKHYVTGPCRFDPRFSKLDLPQMVRDAGTVLRRAESDTHVDARRAVLYGWSEGSTVAAALAPARPELRAIAFQGPVTASWKDVFTYQVERVALPYLRRFAPDGRSRRPTSSAPLRTAAGSSPGRPSSTSSIPGATPRFTSTPSSTPTTTA
jgi:uncharacterized protein